MAFAKDFVWGAASSAYQTEGSPRADGGGESIWDVFCRRPGAVADGFDGSAATDAYRRYEEDIACAAQMGLGAYRFSVSWARVDPYGDGRWNGEGFAFYLRMLQACRAAGLEPYVTLYHWELPQALEDAGGWRSRETARAFARYAAEAARRFSGLAENLHYAQRAGVYCKAGPRYGRACPGPASARGAPASGAAPSAFGSRPCRRQPFGRPAPACASALPQQGGCAGPARTAPPMWRLPAAPPSPRRTATGHLPIRWCWTLSVSDIIRKTAGPACGV